MVAGRMRGMLWGALWALELHFVFGQATSCGPGLYLLGTGTNERCCHPCAAKAQSCLEQGHNCTCVLAEHYCKDLECTHCVHHPCPPGQQLRKHGDFVFNFECVDCAVGTFSTDHGGRCRPWADCSKLGFSTTFTGNKTHNARCQPELVPTQLQCPLTRLLLAIAACSLGLAAAQLGLYVWQLRRERARHPWPGEVVPSLAPDPGPSPESLQDVPPEDACSCQFPEEEWGERLSENKGQIGNLWV